MNQAVVVTATGDVVAAGRHLALAGFYVSSTASGTLQLRRGGASGTLISGTITPAVGWHEFPADCPDGLHVTVGGTINVTFFVKPM